MKEKILHSVLDGIRAIEQLALPKNLAFMEAASELLIKTFRNGNKLIVAGNGGSLCDSAHFAEELAGFYRKIRPALPAIALTEPGLITCVGNDVAFEEVFKRGVEAYGKPGDLFVGLTTSGNSPNLIHAFKKAKEMGLHTLAFLGRGGGKLKGFADLEIIIEGFAYSDRIQEAHMAAIHILVEMVEDYFFNKPQKEAKEELLLSGNLA